MVDVNVKVPALEKLLDYTASGIGAVAGPMLAPWKARKEAEAPAHRVQGGSRQLEADRRCPGRGPAFARCTGRGGTRSGGNRRGWHQAAGRVPGTEAAGEHRLRGPGRRRRAWRQGGSRPRTRSRLDGAVLRTTFRMSRRRICERFGQRSFREKSRNRDERRCGRWTF